MKASNYQVKTSLLKTYIDFAEVSRHGGIREQEKGQLLINGIRCRGGTSIQTKKYKKHRKYQANLDLMHDAQQTEKGATK
jgi:hypothetical protein